ncbi:Amino-acid N-acetyltransferase [Handroanthus impetiginosus]|uniref:Amino-acid N-acetyltransferase n=1 Tax=Handroanthus impetiginosus TaxID=429701 RepID=A0A2G9HYZ0_9LAMI|nr:Amino-acid N-acetyltransferase [Handroanthus impetiginosus]
MDEKSSKSEGEEGIQEFSKITLRPIELSDVDDFMVWATDVKVSKFCLWDAYTSKEQALDYIQNIAIPHPWLRAICIGNRAIGTISVTPCSGFHRCGGKLGYVLAYKYWGKGIVTRAVKMVVNTIFNEWPHLDRLQAEVHVDNKGSQRVLEKAGFEKEGVLRKYVVMKGKTADVVMFSFLRNDPRAA